MAGKWWEGIAGFLGELGGSIGREIEAWKGAGLLEKKEGVLLWNSEGKEEGFGGEFSLGLWPLSEMPRTLSDSLLLLSLLWNWRVKRKKKGGRSLRWRKLQWNGSLVR